VIVEQIRLITVLTFGFFRSKNFCWHYLTTSKPDPLKLDSIQTVNITGFHYRMALYCSAKPVSPLGGEMMNIIKRLIMAYFKNALLFLVIFYLITAPKTGPFILHWQLGNSYLTGTYLIGYPLLTFFAPSKLTQPLTFVSAAAKSYARDLKDIPGQSRRTWSTINPMVRTRSIMTENGASDNLITASLNMLIQGAVMVFSGPILLVICYQHGLKKHRRKNWIDVKKQAIINNICWLWPALS